MLERFVEQTSFTSQEDFKQHLKKAKYDWFAEGFEKEIQNRTMLRDMMENVGLKALEHEWWHFNLPNKEKYPLIEAEFEENGQARFFVQE